MDSEALILVMSERMALQCYSPNTIKAYKQYAQVFLQAMSDYTRLKKIPVSEIEGFINRMVTDNKISVSYQRSLVGAIKKLYELTLDEKVKLDYLYPKRNFSSLPKFFSKDEIKRVFDATDNLKHKAILIVTLPKYRTGWNAKIRNFNFRTMKKTRISESQIVAAIKQHESGKSTADICRELGVHQATFYNWKKKYSGMDNQELRRLKELEEENRRLKHMYAELALDNKILKDVLSKKF